MIRAIVNQQYRKEQRHERPGWRQLRQMTGSTEQATRRQYTELVGPPLQLADAAIAEAQTRSRLVQRLASDGMYRGMGVLASFGLLVI